MTRELPADIASLPGYARVFERGRLTLGLMAPIEGYPGRPGPTLHDHAALVRQADRLGFAAIWARDVPFYDPRFGDVGQILDPMIYLGWLAAHTREIAIGTAGIVLPLRDPVLVAKQAASVDQLLGGRFILGLSSGDRPTEYPAMGREFDDRADRFREARQIIDRLTTTSFPSFTTRHYGTFDGGLDLVPKPVGPRLPTVAIGRGGQDFAWLYANMDAWIWHLSDFAKLPDVIGQWHAVGEAQGLAYKPYGYSTFFELAEDPDTPLQYAHGIRIGRHAFVELLHRQQREGVCHLAINLRPSRRPSSEVLDELAEFVLPHFPSVRGNADA
ncbi:LLM class oxidoreductase [Sphingomonas sp. Leaf25]|uniref:LLM class oxidoreductase n=1 Tax=Sphingomonas sp. Leaf25 TaxID=1735692 RepID=UPI0006F311AC|nr:LLM class oxidoreductase [Sphingomonas sp. Leaf25]KQM99385.1 luciferase [Sphingomonas sp. Leaf25]